MIIIVNTSIDFKRWIVDDVFGNIKKNECYPPVFRGQGK